MARRSPEKDCLQQLPRAGWFPPARRSPGGRTGARLCCYSAGCSRGANTATLSIKTAWPGLCFHTLVRHTFHLSGFVNANHHTVKVDYGGTNFSPRVSAVPEAHRPPAGVQSPSRTPSAPGQPVLHPGLVWSVAGQTHAARRP